MRCEVCNIRLNKKWNFCPNCGVMVGTTNLVEFFKRQPRYFSQKLEEMNDEMEIPKNISITVIPTQLKPKMINSEPLRMPKKVVEPETMAKRTSNEIIFTLKLPGVKKKEDIDIQIYSNSVEVRAIAKDMGYFKIINLPEKYVLDKRFDDDELILHFFQR
ncbi:MAG: hypothetical protein N3E38_01730 [Candidatus Aenigmarchaeota archaeon]|nr:hypothetical protein [Candidatus Aenigmarchaeota archaeon]